MSKEMAIAGIFFLFLLPFEEGYKRAVLILQYVVKGIPD